MAASLRWVLHPARDDLDHLLDDLEPAQREAVVATTGPVVILAGAGTGKTRVISRRTAYAVETGAVAADQVLVVTFTEKAAGEMVQRLRGLGLPGITARTFHAHALSQLRHFWPSRHEGYALPEILDSKMALLVPIARRLPGHYRFTPAKDLADEIEWAKSRRIGPRAYEAAAEVAGRTPPLPIDLMRRVYDDYERAKTRTNRLDFDDMLTKTVELLENDAEAASTVRARKSWFSVDEYQDTNPLQQRLLELWAGDRDDVCVVGDEDQTIYSFTGASAEFLTGFAARYPGARVVELTANYRSTPQVLELANRLLAAEGRTKHLDATHGDGPSPAVIRHADAAAELAAIVAGVQRLVGEGVAPAEIAVLVRMNAQLVELEEAFTRAGIAYQVRGRRFYDRPDVRAAIEVLRRMPDGETGAGLRRAVLTRWRDAFGYEPDGAGDPPGGEEARERTAALDTLLGILEDRLAADASTDGPTLLAELDRRARHEKAASADGVNLLTYHRAKGLEWDAVFLPMLEEGSLPIRQAADDDAALAEERRLLYVGITRARRHLVLSWSERREVRGRESRRQASRFLEALRPPRGSRVTELPDAFRAPPARRPARAGESDDPVFAALREWRAGRARDDAVPAYVVAHDSTLAAIAEARPQTLAQLRRVKGMGPTKLERYGAEILAALGSTGET
jgi:DNA helicase-2/ATP-dependent DNA helicase PcrA